MNLKKEIILRSIKIIDIGYVTIIYGFLAIYLSKVTEKYLGKFDEEKEKNKTLTQSILELTLYLWGCGVVIYIVRNLVPLVPFPLNGVYGFDHLKVKEVTNASVFSIIFIYFQQHYQDKIKYIYSNIFDS